VLLEEAAPSRTKRRRQRKRRRVYGRLFVIVVALAVIAGAVTVGTRLKRAHAPKAVIGEQADGGQLTLLLAMTLQDDPSQQADSLTLFGVERSGAHPVVSHNRRQNGGVPLGRC
jgi:anti-sigma-K factor RskA